MRTYPQIPSLDTYNLPCRTGQSSRRNQRTVFPSEPHWRAYEYALQDTAFWQQAMACQAMVLDGPGKLMHFGVPDGTWADGRGSASTGELVQAGLVVPAARIAALDERDWRASGQPVIIRGRGPCAEIDAEGFGWFNQPEVDLIHLFVILFVPFVLFVFLW